MRRTSDKPMTKMVVRIFDEDLAILRRNYSAGFGVNRAIRQIVHVFITQTNASADAKIDQLETMALLEGDEP
jgi:hypothetical protein